MANCRSGVLDSPKINNNHATATKEAQIVIEIAKPLDAVTKIVLGKIVPVGSKKRKLKIRPILAGYEVVVYGTGIQTLYIYTKDSKVPSILEKAFEA